MTVAELIAELQTCENQDAIVVLQKDAEGNGYSPLRGVDVQALYQAHTTYSGEAYSIEDGVAGVAGCVPCCVLHPIN